MIAFNVPGKPQPKGSIRAVPHRTTGKIMMLGANAKGKRHEKLIGQCALAAGVKLAPPDVPVFCSLTFSLARPQFHYRANGSLRDDAPTEPTKKPDSDKLVRLVLDSLTGIAYADDAQVTSIVARKRYALDRGEGETLIWLHYDCLPKRESEAGP